MAKTQKRTIGDLGEDLVCKYLFEKGFQVVCRNYLKPWGEIDIVTKKNSRLHFIEVKSVTREPGRGGFRPEENMHYAKIRRLNRAIQTYLIQHEPDKEIDWQIDLACVYIDLATQKARIDILENIF